MPIIEMRVPTIGESINEVTLSQWLKEDGTYVERDEAICEFESDKATLEFPAEASGKLIHVAQEGDDLEIGALVARIDTDAMPEKKGEVPAVENEEAGPSGKSEPQPAADTVSVESYATGHASPAAAKLMREAGLQVEQVQGTGKGGRITKQDVLDAIARQPQVEKAVDEQVAEDTAQITSSFGESPSRSERRKKMSRMRRTIARRLVSAKNQTAMLTTFNEVDLTEVIALRKKYQDQFVEKYGIKLGFMSLFAKACAKALMEMPDVNAFIDGDEIVYHDYVDISIAISTPNGLVVPPVKNVESLHFAEIERKIKELAAKAREGKLSLEEMSGGTFTITNGGVFGSLLSTPILNEPQSAILGMHAIQERPVAINGQVEIRPMMYLALSYDHRIIDGSTSVTFLVRVKNLLEDPVKLLMDL